jgi:hypothetical protein
MKHEWNVIIVDKHGYPRKSHKEFQVVSKSMLGATMKATKKIKKDYDGWKINSIWFLDPNRVKREIS